MWGGAWGQCRLLLLHTLLLALKTWPKTRYTRDIRIFDEGKEGIPMFENIQLYITEDPTDGHHPVPAGSHHGVPAGC